MKSRHCGPRLLMVALLFLTACAAPPQPETAAPADPDLESGWRLARFAFLNGQYPQAVGLYERVQERAYARDDAGAIGDIGYEYSMALLRNGSPDQAIAQVERTRVELQRRDSPVFAELFLVEAIAQNEVGNADRARKAARDALTRARADDADTRGRAHFLLGMLAADANDAATVRQSLAALGAPSNDALKADVAELRGRLLLLEGKDAAALPPFMDAAASRRDLRDYTGMARALSYAGTAAELGGDSAAAADLYYRAGLSAISQNDTARARAWLNKALHLASRNGLAVIESDARDRLKTLKK